MNKSLQEILNGDSLYILKNHIEDNLIDIIITSPPYNVAHQYENYNDDLDFESYLNLMHDIFKECYRVLKKDGRICVNVPFAVKNRDSKEVRFLSVYITQILNEIGFKEFELITWHKGKDIKHFQGNNTAWGSWKSPSCPSFRPLGEAILVFYKENKIHKTEGELADITSQEFKECLPKTNALKPLAFSYGDTRRNAFRRANME
nr:site-specific DNA-methyltransferase [Helicobacter pylori]